MSEESFKRILKDEFIIKGVVMIQLGPLLLFMYGLSGPSGSSLMEAFLSTGEIQLIFVIISYIINRKKLHCKNHKKRYFLFQFIYSIIMCLIITISYSFFI